MSLLGAVAFALFAALFARIWFLQIINEQEFVQLAEGNTERTIVELAPRGRILDAEGRVLVDNRPSIVITIDRETVATSIPEDELQDMFLRLAQEISATGKLTKVSEINRAFESDRFGPFAEVPVVRDVSENLQLYLAERSHEFPGVNSQVVLVRSYPYGNLAAHLLGYVGALNEEEEIAVANKPKNYQKNDEIGKSGIELFYEDALRGTPGVRTVEVDRFSNVVAVLQNDPPVAGSDVQLTLDIELQGLAEAELAQALELARLQEPDEVEGEGFAVFNAPAGAVVILDPNSGDVRAMASFPTYDPTLFVNGISASAFDELNDPENDLPLLNRAIQGTYAPGSTFKPFTTYAALDTGLIGSRGILGVGTPYLDEGTYRIPGCPTDDCLFRNAGSEPLGSVDLELALTLSSDVYFYNLAANFDRLNFDRDSVQQAAGLFGFGQPTGITLPAEASGRLPTPASVAAAYEANPDLFETGAWTTGMTLNTSIGQGDVLATPLQIANAYAVIANGGTLHAPNLGAAVLNPITQSPELEFGPRVLRELYWPQAFRAPIDAGLAGVTTFGPDDEDRAGTARKAFEDFPHDQWSVSGKTGTSEKQRPGRVIADSALFAGFGPMPNPEYVAVAILEEAGFGGDHAAPIVRKIFQHIADGTVPPVLTQAEQDAVDAATAEAFEASDQTGDEAAIATEDGGG
ncbi:MAG: penicillin-binding protein 2 [Acidimicrobiales bacterium]